MSTSDNKTPSDNGYKSGFNISVKECPKLHGQENYQTWADAWEVAFDILELWDVVSGESTKPDPPTEGPTVTGSWHWTLVQGTQREEGPKR